MRKVAKKGSGQKRKGREIFDKEIDKILLH